MVISSKPPPSDVASSSQDKDKHAASQSSSTSDNSMLFFGGLVLAVAGNVLVARRYGKRVMQWSIPKEAKYNQYQERNMYSEYWDPGLRRARWEAYFSAAAEEERQQAERIYQWMMYEKEKENLKEKLHRFYHEKVDSESWESEGFRPEDFYGAGGQYQQQHQQFGGGRHSSNSFQHPKLSWSMQVLGLQGIRQDKLTEDLIKAAFRKEALKFHPDRVPDAEERKKKSTKFKEANEAYNFLMERVGERRRSPGFDDDDW